MKYARLDQKGSIMAEYVWIDGHNGLRSKTKVSEDFRDPTTRSLLLRLPAACINGAKDQAVRAHNTLGRIQTFCLATTEGCAKPLRTA